MPSQPTSHSSCGFRSGVDEVPNFRAGAEVRERRVEGRARHSRRSPRGSPEEVKQISRNAIARFGDVFHHTSWRLPTQGMAGSCLW